MRAVSDPDPLAPGVYAPGDYHWVNQTACTNGATCVEIDSQTAVCSDSSQPTDQCQNGGSICWQGSVASCKGGYPTIAQTCNAASCKQSTVNGTACSYCDDGTGLADTTCALGSAYTCSNNAIYQCVCSDRRALYADCTSADYCVTAQRPGSGTPMLDTFCAMAPNPEPQCGNEPPAYVCIGHQKAFCTDGYAVRAPNNLGCP